MRLLPLALLAALAAPAVLSQTVTPRGTATTLDVATWNLAFFGTTSPAGQPDSSPNDVTQFQFVEAVIAQGGLDLWALQEVSDGDDFDRLLDSLSADGYSGLLGPSVSSTPNEPFDQKLAFVYDASVISPIGGLTTLFPNETYEFAGRLPQELRATVTVEGQSEVVRFIVFHAKASGGVEDYNRRDAAAATLKAYVDGLVDQGEAVVILGDFNDGLTSTSRGSTFDSPYAEYVDDADYGKVTLATEEAGLATFCGRDTREPASCDGSRTIDHILYTTPTLGFVPAAGNPQLQRYGELLTDLPQYTLTTSDHLPALANLTLSGSVTSEADPSAGPVALLAPAPSPFREATALRFRLDAPADVTLDVVDVLGRQVAAVAGTYGAGEHTVALDGRGLAPGLYVVRLRAGDAVKARTLVRTR